MIKETIQIDASETEATLDRLCKKVDKLIEKLEKANSLVDELAQKI
ncbi:hypothetical protein [Companilactobacillus tucceti]|nr:hypothetical protein [Companilactobacillus tucceti]